VTVVCNFARRHIYRDYILNRKYKYRTQRVNITSHGTREYRKSSATIIKDDRSRVSETPRQHLRPDVLGDGAPAEATSTSDAPCDSLLPWTSGKDPFNRLERTRGNC